jgi:sortase A
MQKHTIYVLGAAEFARPGTRRDFFKSLAVAGAGATAASMLVAGKASAKTDDVDIANFALSLEYLEADFYARALDAGVLSGNALDVVENLQSHESQHVDAIKGLRDGAGATPVSEPTLTYPADAFSSQASILDLAATFEPVGVGAYLGAAPLITSPDILAAAGSIAGVEGEHVVAINWLLGVVPYANGPEKIVHRAESGNLDENSTYLDDPIINGKPGAILSVTQNWNPGGGGGTYNDHPVEARYDTGRHQWAIYNTDGSAMPDGAAFNVAVSGVAPMTGSDAGAPDHAAKPTKASGSETTTEAVLPKDILDKKDLEKTTPEYEDWYKAGSDPSGTETSASGTSAGAIPAARPFNLGKDPGGPDDKTLYLTVPALGLTEVPVYNSVEEEKLKKSVVHIPATGFPWQEGANTYIAGHRLGYEGTGSYLVFYYLDQLGDGDEITAQKVVDPDNVGVMEPEAGRSLVSLQTCTLPDYKQRLIVQGELVETRS